MAINTDRKESGDAIQLMARRADGTVRQVLVQTSDGKILARGFFPPGTSDADDGWLQTRKFHWIDAWDDKELLSNPDLNFTVDSIQQLREESILANINKQFVVDSIENYKRV